MGSSPGGVDGATVGLAGRRRCEAVHSRGVSPCTVSPCAKANHFLAPESFVPRGAASMLTRTRASPNQDGGSEAMSYAQLLSNISIFENLQAEELEHLSTLLRSRRY